MTMNNIHEQHWAGFMEDDFQRGLYESWWTTKSVAYWRQTRLMAPVLELLPGFRGRSWLTIGDGAGYDAWRMKLAGFTDVLATDLDASVLARSKAAGYIDRYQVENAEKLSFADNTFDFILCKEALHHMSRPYAALYEMFRVARYGVVIVEPQDSWIDLPCADTARTPKYEPVGNFVYTFSEREIEKIAYGLNIRGLAAKKIMDTYVPGSETAVCEDGDPVWIETRDRVELNTRRFEAGQSTASYLLAAFFKGTVDVTLFDHLKNEHPSWRFTQTDTNPHLNGRHAF